MDNGTEWKGEFEALLKDGLGITFSWISIGNSRANGQAERMIRTLKDIIRREDVLEAGFWSDALPLALTAMRMTSA
jgi:transposase InsO family protein